jgi:hypothetical protein
MLDDLRLERTKQLQTSLFLAVIHHHMLHSADHHFLLFGWHETRPAPNYPIRAMQRIVVRLRSTVPL